MTPKYETVLDLLTAVSNDRLRDLTAHLDNDNVYFMADTAPGHRDKVLELHPSILLEQALDLLGIEHEGV